MKFSKIFSNRDKIALEILNKIHDLKIKYCLAKF